MAKVSIDRKRHIFKAITWNLLAMTTTYLVLTLLPPFFLDFKEFQKKVPVFLQ